MSFAGDHYKTLGASVDASSEALRLAYRDLMRKVHPDINKSDEAAAQARAAIEAYRILANPEARALYDKKRLRRERGVPIRAPVLERSDARRQVQHILEQQFNPRPSWTPFLAFVLISAAGVGILIASGAVDPTVLTAPDVRDPPIGSAEKQTDDLVSRIANADLRAPSTGSTGNLDAPPSEQQDATSHGVIKPQTPISSDLALGAAAFAQISLKSGMNGARQFSEQCHRRAATSKSLREADRCIAFDFTGGYVDAEVSAATLHPPNAYFEVQGNQAAQVYKSVGLPAETASIRLAAVKRVVLPMIATAN